MFRETRNFFPRLLMIVAIAVSMVNVLQCGAYAEEMEEDTQGAFKQDITLEEIFAQVQGRAYDSSQGGIEAPLWKLGAHTHFSTAVDARVSVGASPLLYLPSWSRASSSSSGANVSLINLELTWHTDFGDFYAGQFQIPWGLEGTTQTSALWLPRSLLYESGSFPLFDLGAGFKSEYNGFFTNIAVHNGTGAGVANMTNRFFVTGQWGYVGPAHLKVGISLTAGRIVAPFVNDETRMRGANGFFGFNIFGLGLQLEGSLIESKTANAAADLLAWHADVEHPVFDWLNLIGRYEQLNSSINVGGQTSDRAFLGAEYHSKDNVSRLFVYYGKSTVSQQISPSNEARIVWRLTPNVVP